MSQEGKEVAVNIRERIVGQGKSSEKDMGRIMNRKKSGKGQNVQSTRGV